MLSFPQQLHSHQIDKLIIHQTAIFVYTNYFVYINFIVPELDLLGGDDNPLADAIMDRIIYDAYKINIESIDPSKDISMREVYGIDQNMVQ